MTFISNVSQKYSIISSRVPRHQRGFSLIELLISLLIFAIGILGIASLQQVTIKMAHDSALQNTAIQLSNTLIEQLRVGAESTHFLSWQERVSQELPQGKATLDKHGNSYQLSMQWQESELSEGSSNLQDYQLKFKIKP